MTDTIIIGNRPVPRTVVGAIGRLELITAKHAPSARADVDFLRARFNEVEAQRDELREALRSMIAMRDKVDPEGLFDGIELIRARAVLAKVGG